MLASIIHIRPLSAPVPLRVVVRARDLAGFMERYRQHIDGDRIFIFTRVPPRVGTRVRFQIHLETGECVLRGEGIVLLLVADSPAQAGGMEVRFVVADEPSRMLVAQMRAQRADGVPVAVVDEEQTIATEPPELDYLVDWSDDAPPRVSSLCPRPAPPTRSLAQHVRAIAAVAWRPLAAMAVQRWRYAAVGGAGVALGLAVGLACGHR
jgi:hypothetical protein